MADHRRQYRTAPPFRDLVSVTVVRPGQADVPGAVEDMAIGGIGVFVQATADAGFEKGEALLIRLTSPWLARPISTTGTIRSLERTEVGTRYGIEFLDWLGLLPQLPAELKALFNQRSGRRLVFRNRPEIQVGDSAAQYQFNAELLNLSATGLGFLIPASCGDWPPIGEHILVTLTVPGSDEQLTLGCRVRDRQLRDDHQVTIHLAFVREGTSNFEPKRDRIAQLVHEMEDRARERAGVKTSGRGAPRN